MMKARTASTTTVLITAVKVALTDARLAAASRSLRSSEGSYAGVRPPLSLSRSASEVTWSLCQRVNVWWCAKYLLVSEAKAVV